MKTTGYWSLGLSAFFLVISSLVLHRFSLSQFPERIIPIFHIARLIKLGRFFQSWNPYFCLSAAAALYISVCFYFILFAFQKTFRLDYYKPLIVPFAIIIMSISFIPTDFSEVITYEVSLFRKWSWIAAFAMPILLLVLARLRNKGAVRKGQAA